MSQIPTIIVAGPSPASPDASATADTLHDAFLSYSRKDTAFVRRLELALRAYRPPRSLAVAQRPLRVFRDETDFTGADYETAVSRHLQASSALIVVCTPHSRASTFVGEEIRRYYAARGSERIVTALADGIPDNESRGDEDVPRLAFHDRLLEAMKVPLACDYRGFDPIKDHVDRGRFENAWYKLLADLYSVERREVEDRERRRRTRQRRAWGAVIAASFFVLAGLTAWALVERDNAVAELRRSTAQRLVAEGQAMTAGIRPEGTWRGLVQILAAHRISPSATSASALLTEVRRFAALRHVRATDSALMAMTLSASGKLLATGSENGNVQLWDAETLTPLGAPWTGHRGAVSGIAFGPNGTVPSVSRDKTLRLWNTATGQLVEPPSEFDSAINAVAYSPDGSRLATGFDNAQLGLWTIPEGREVEPTDPKQRSGHADSVEAIAFSADGARLVSAGNDSWMRLRDARTGALLGTKFEGLTSTVYALAFSPDDKTLASGDYNGSVRLWDVSTGAALRAAVVGHTDPVASFSLREGRRTDLAFSPDGRFIISASVDATLRFWYAHKGTLVREPLRGHFGPVGSVAYSRDGRLVYSAGIDGTLRAWEASTSVPSIAVPLQGQHRDHIVALAYSPDGTRLASGGPADALKLWDRKSGNLIADVTVAPRAWIEAVAWRCDGKQLATAHSDGTFTLRDGNSGEVLDPPVRVRAHADTVHAIAYSPDGRLVATGGADARVALWNAADGSAAGEAIAAESSVSALAWSPDGRNLVTAHSDGHLRLWDAASRKQVVPPLSGHDDYVRAVAFSPDGKRIASAGDDKRVRMWDARLGTALLRPLEGHTYTVYDVAFSPDGAYLVSGSDDMTLRFWNATTGEPLGPTLQGHRWGVFRVVFSPDGRQVASGGADGRVMVWPAFESWADLLCAKLGANPTPEQWREWVGNAVAQDASTMPCPDAVVVGRQVH